MGLACNCHTHFGEYCVVELGRNVKDKNIHSHSTLKNVYAGSGRSAFYKELNSESFPDRFSDSVAYDKMELDFLQIMERE